MGEKEKIRAERNRTITISEAEALVLDKELLTLEELKKAPDTFIDRTINADLLQALTLLPDSFADLIIIDPPYNLTKNFNGNVFSARNNQAYQEYLESWFPLVCKKLKPTASLYLCGDWKCTAALQTVMQKELTVINRITWQREKQLEKWHGRYLVWRKKC